MARPQSFSETTFAFAATNEISRLAPWWSAHVPILPSLRRERRGGYDVRFDLPATVLLIQYKLSTQLRQLKIMRRPRGSSEIIKRARAACRHGFFQFWTKDHQHRLLDRVAGKFPYTYYVAPRFVELADLHANYESRSILANSIVIRLSQFPASKPGSSAQHRVISPHLSSRNFVFSRPRVTERVSLRLELREAWRDWVHEIPLGAMIEEIWDGLPRVGKTRALKWARREFAMVRDESRPLYEPPIAARDAPRLVAQEDGASRAARGRRPRRPPWPPSLFRDQRGTGLVEYDDKNIIQLLALAKVFSLAGLTFGVLQPSDKALENTEFYDLES